MKIQNRLINAVYSQWKYIGYVGLDAALMDGLANLS